ncbi:MAG: ABC-2 family transporter protein [Myxococcales bacterium]|nr:ABC-2 family transporter protein [Myxococcales bacterium]
MKRLAHIARALWACSRVAVMTALQYRVSFLGEAIVAVFWLTWTVAPLFVLFQFDAGTSGWTRDEALLVVAFFVTLSGLLDAFIDPNLTAVVEHVRQGTFDFLLLKPIDPQLLVSLHRSAPAKLPHVVVGLAIAAWASARLPSPPTPTQALLALALLISGASILHSLWTIVVSLSFKFVRVDNLSFLLRAIVDAGRWPTAFYPAAVRIVLTFIIPVGLMTTYPALALRGAVGPRGALAAFGVATLFALAARLSWRTALRHYSSASS